MNIKDDKWIDGYVDSMKLRFDFIDKDLRDEIYSRLILFIKEIKLVGIYYDKKVSNSFHNCTKLISYNTTIADISKSVFPNLYTNISNYYISISFHGLKRYNKEIDDRSELLLKNILAFINSEKMLVPAISQFDICTDIPSNIENILVFCVNRNKRKKYYPLGTYDKDGNKIQIYDGTYEVEKFARDDDKEKFPIQGELLKEIAKRRNNVQKRASLYDKRKKILNKTKYDLGYDLTRFEMKLQTRHFVNNEVSVNAFLQELKDYRVLHFDDIKQKEEFIRNYNKANNNKHRNELVEKASAVAPTIKTNMSKIGEFIRMIDTIKFKNDGTFTIARKEDYLYGTSKFNK